MPSDRQLPAEGALSKSQKSELGEKLQRRTEVGVAVTEGQLSV